MRPGPRKEANHHKVTYGASTGREKCTIAGQILRRGCDGLRDGGGVKACWNFLQPTLVGLESVSTGLEGSAALSRYTRKLVNWIVVLYQSRGPSGTVKRLKELALACRQESLGLSWSLKFRGGIPSLLPLLRQEVRHRLMQFSRFARALPAPGRKEGSCALKEHKVILVSGFVVAPPLLEELRTFSRTLGETYGSEVEYGFSVPSLSASLESKRGEGGVAGCVSSLTDKFRGLVGDPHTIARMVSLFPIGLFGGFAFYCHVNDSGELYRFKPGCRLDECCFLYRKEYEMSLDAWELCRERLFSIAACWEAVSWDEVPRVRRVVILERGWKTRVVTPEEAAFAYLCSIGNSILLGILRNHPAVKGSLKGNPADNINWSTGKAKRVVRSLDLASASDYLTHEVNHAVIAGLLEGCKAPFWLKTLAFRAVGPHLVVERSGATWVTRCAALMGNPLTWPILNIVLDFAHVKSGTDGFYALNGDDYIGAHTWKTNALFTLSVRSLGLKLSPTKDFVTGNHSGVFAEELVAVGRNKVYPTCSVRPLCAVQKVPDHPLWGDGPAVSTAVGRLPKIWQPSVEKLIGITYKNEFDKLVRTGIDPHAPRWCGGAGFPGVPSLNSLRTARGILSQDSKQALSWILDFAASWSAAADSMAMGHARELVDAVIAENPSQTTEEGMGRTGDEILAFTLGLVSPHYLIALGPQCVERRIRLTSVGMRIKRVLKGIRERCYWVPRDQLIRDWGGLDRKLVSLEPRYTMKAPVFLCDLKFNTPPSLWSVLRKRRQLVLMTDADPNLPYKRRRL